MLCNIDLLNLPKRALILKLCIQDFMQSISMSARSHPCLLMMIDLLCLSTTKFTNTSSLGKCGTQFCSIIPNSMENPYKRNISLKSIDINVREAELGRKLLTYEFYIHIKITYLIL
jgi:hypothetical protein